MQAAVNYAAAFPVEILWRQAPSKTLRGLFGSDKSRATALEMICADFLAGAHLENPDPRILLSSTLRLLTQLQTKRLRLCLDANAYRNPHRRILERDGWRICYPLFRLPSSHSHLTRFFSS